MPRQVCRDLPHIFHVPSVGDAFADFERLRSQLCPGRSLLDIIASLDFSVALSLARACSLGRLVRLQFGGMVPARKGKASWKRAFPAQKSEPVSARAKGKTLITGQWREEDTDQQDRQSTRPTSGLSHHRHLAHDNRCSARRGCACCAGAPACAPVSLLLFCLCAARYPGAEPLF